MTDQEQRMLAYATLASLSREKGQSGGYVRFVILSGIAACRSGYRRVASQSRELVLASNSRHLLSHFETLEDALRSDEFVPYLHHLDRFCTFERAEHLLDQLSLDWKPDDETLELEPAVLELLGEID